MWVQKEEEAPVQREPATTSDHEAGLDTTGVDGALRGGGRPLDPATRRSMEARFGYDFSSVRVHDDGGAAAVPHAMAAHLRHGICCVGR